MTCIADDFVGIRALGSERESELFRPALAPLALDVHGIDVAVEAPRFLMVNFGCLGNREMYLDGGVRHIATQG